MFDLLSFIPRAVVQGIPLLFGATEISTIFSLNHSFGDILTGIILFFIIGSEFFINYQLHFRKKAELPQGEGANHV